MWPAILASAIRPCPTGATGIALIGASSMAENRTIHWVIVLSWLGVRSTQRMAPYGSVDSVTPRPRASGDGDNLALWYFVSEHVAEPKKIELRARR
jgi:hypothetical protein